MEKIITIDKIEARLEGETIRFHVLHEGDEYYYVWKNELVSGVNEGDQVKINFQPGRWKRVITLEKIEARPSVFSPLLMSKATSALSGNVVTRSHALIAACTAFPWHKGEESIEDACKRITIVAEAFEAWIEKEKK